MRIKEVIHGVVIMSLINLLVSLQIVSVSVVMMLLHVLVVLTLLLLQILFSVKHLTFLILMQMIILDVVTKLSVLVDLAVLIESFIINLSLSLIEHILVLTVNKHCILVLRPSISLLSCEHLLISCCSSSEASIGITACANCSTVQ